MYSKRARQLWRKIFSISILVGLMAAVIGFLSEPIRKAITSPATDLLVEGDQFATEQRLPEAVLSYRQAVEADPQNPDALIALAEAYQNQGRLRMSQHYREKWAKITGQIPPDMQAILNSRSINVQRDWILVFDANTPTGASVQSEVVIVGFETGEVAAVHKNGTLAWKIQLPAIATSAPSAGKEAAWIGAQDGAVYKISLADGKLIWRFQTSAPVYAQPLADSGMVYCASSDGSLYAVDEASGMMIWKFRTGGALLAAPSVENGRLFVGSTDGKLYAMDAISGAPLWQDGILTSGAVESQPVVVEERVVFGSSDGRVYVLDANTGGEFWRYSTGDAVYAAAVIDEDIVYIASSGNSLHAVDLLRGERIWKRDFSSALRNPPAIKDDLLMVIIEADSQVHLLDKKTGTDRGTIETGDWITAGPWVEGGHFYLLGKDGAVMAYNFP